MKTVKILHCADIHIGAAESFLKTAAESRRIETLLTFERIIDIAISEKVELIALAGDIFDSNSVKENFVDSVFSKIAACKIPTVFAAGNHDPLNNDSPFKTRELPENLFVLDVTDDCLTFEDLGVKVYGRSFESAFLKGTAAFSIKPSADYINIMVQHGDLCSDLNSDYNAITPTFVKKSGMDYIALGHIHKRTPVGKIENTSFAYCGCPEGQGFDELDQKGVYIGNIGKGVCELQFVPVSKRQHILHKKDISGVSSAQEISAAVLAELETAHGKDFCDNLYKIELIGSVTPDTIPDLAEITARLSEKLYFVKCRDCTEFSSGLETLAAETSLKGLFVAEMLKKLESAKAEELPLITEALKLGLKAFDGEVQYNED